MGLGVGVIDTEQPTLGLDFGLIRDDKRIYHFNFGIYQNEIKPEYYNISGSTFNDPTSGVYKQNNTLTIGYGVKVFQVKKVKVFLMGEITHIQQQQRIIYKDNSGILGGGDNRYITNTGKIENRNVISGGIMVKVEKFYINTSVSPKLFSVNLGHIW